MVGTPEINSERRVTITVYPVGFSSTAPGKNPTRIPLDGACLGTLVQDADSGIQIPVTFFYTIDGLS